MFAINGNKFFARSATASGYGVRPRQRAQKVSFRLQPDKNVALCGRNSRAAITTATVIFKRAVYAAKQSGTTDLSPLYKGAIFVFEAKPQKNEDARLRSLTKTATPNEDARLRSLTKN